MRLWVLMFGLIATGPAFAQEDPAPEDPVEEPANEENTDAEPVKKRPRRRRRRRSPGTGGERKPSKG